jgi:hypothetical protein
MQGNRISLPRGLARLGQVPSDSNHADPDCADQAWKLH